MVKSMGEEGSVPDILAPVDGLLKGCSDVHAMSCFGRVEANATRETAGDD